MKFKLLSDLHLEDMQGYHKKRQPWAIHTDEDLLVLAGDIHVGLSNVVETISYFLDQGFPEIVYTPGNHEQYGYQYDPEFAEKVQSNFSTKVHVLDCKEVITIKDTKVYGGQLYSNFDYKEFNERLAKVYVNDFRIIPGWTVDKHKELNQKHRDFIKAQNNDKALIVTHFMPSKTLITSKFEGSPLNSYFADDLTDAINLLENKTWVFGHTHDQIDETIGTTRLISNPKGYNQELNNFNPNLSITI